VDLSLPPTDRTPAAAVPAAAVPVAAIRGRVIADNVGRAVLYMIFAAALIPLLNASAKYLTRDYPPVEIVWARYAGHFVYMLLAFAPRRGVRLLVTAQPALQLVRSALLCTSTAIYIVALTYTSLPTAAAIGFTGPLIVTALSPFLLGESVGLRRWMAVAVGFIGALIVVRPGMGVQHWAALLVFGSATTSALYQIFTRKLAAHDPAETSITYIALVGFLLTSLALPFYWMPPLTILDGFVFVGLGIFGGFGHYFMVRAYELAPASFISPFNYAQLIGSVVLSYAVFGEFPDVWTWVGSGVIIGSGLFVLARERKKAISRPAAAP
jgi:drug/metabolite transporter (DMT)-like permease